MARRNRARFVAGKMSRSTCFVVALGWGCFITSEEKGCGVPRCGALSSQLVIIKLRTWRGWRGPKERSPSLVTVLWFQDYFSTPRGLSTSHEHLGTRGGWWERNWPLSSVLHRDGLRAKTQSWRGTSDQGEDTTSQLNFDLYKVKNFKIVFL